MTKFSRLGIRARLISLFSLILIPFALFRVYDFREQRERVVDQSRDRAMAIFNLAVANEQVFLQETQELLSRLSTAPAIVRQEGCSEYLSEVLAFQSHYLMLGVARSDGQVICSTSAIEKPIDVSDRPYFITAIETGSFSIGRYQTDRVTNRTTINYGYPVLTRNKDRIGGVVFAARDISSFAEFETALSPIVPAGSTFAKIDAAGTVLSNFPNSPDLPMGKPASEGLLKKIRDEEQGSIVLEGPDGVERLYLFSALWTVPYGKQSYVVLSVPMKSLLADADRTLFWNLGILLGIAVFLATVLRFIGNRLIIEPVNRFVEASKRLAAGELNTRVGPVGCREFDNLSSVFDNMAEELGKKTKALENQAALLGEAEARLVHIVSVSPAVIFTGPAIDWDGQGDYPDEGYVPQFMSSNVKDLLGYEAREMMDPSIFIWRKWVHPDDYPTARNLGELFRTGKICREYRLRARDGSYRWVLENVVLARDEAGKPVEVTGTWVDISDRKKSEETSVKLAMVVDQAADAVLILDTQTNVEYANPTFERISGFSLGQIIGNNIRNIGSATYEEFSREGKDLLNQGKVWKKKVFKQRDDGVSFVVEVVVSPFRDAFGKIVNYIVWGRDVTRESAMQQQLQNSQRLESVGVLAGGIAHDFNNSLTGIFGFTEMAMQEADGNQAIKLHLNEILKCARSSASLTKQLLAYSRRQIINPANINLNNVIADRLKLITKVAGEQISIRTVFDKKPSIVKADVGQIEQALMNLVINAKDAMPDGGDLLIETGTEDLVEEKALPYPGFKPGKYVVLKVADTGAGMDEITRGRVFDPFFTTKAPEKGTGLGLAVVYGIVKQHEGYIEVQSEIGRGTTFQIFFPVVDAVETEAEMILPVEVRGGNEVLLLGEDNDTVRYLARETLRIHGYTVLEAENGKAAVELFARNRDRISLTLLDMVMPVMGGVEAYSEIVRLDPGHRVIFMSGHSESVARASFSQGMDVPFLVKPFTPKDLARKVREVLDRANV